MDLRAPLVISGLLIGGMLAVSAWAWPLIPQTAEIAVHFDLDGNANGWMRRDVALLFAPVTACIVAAAFAVLPVFVRRRKEGLNASSAGYVTGWIGALVLLFVTHCSIVLAARGWQFDLAGNSALAVALVFTALGNVLGKTRPNPYVGVRTPWTHRSDYSWDKTNRAAGRMLVAVGLATLAALAVSGSREAHIVLFGGILAMAAVSVFLSYIYWRRDPGRQPTKD